MYIETQELIKNYCNTTMSKYDGSRMKITKIILILILYEKKKLNL